MMGEMPNEWKNSIVIPYTRKVTNKRWNTTHELTEPMHVFGMANRIPKMQIFVSIQISTKLLTELNLETHFAFPDYVESL
jgi:hypothetical protein